MTTALSRIIKYGLQIFWRNGWVSVATILVMVLALLVFHNLIIFNVLTSQVTVALNDKIDISVYFKNNIQENNILELQDVLRDLSEVKNVEYISQAKALEIFRDKHKDDEVIAKSLEVLDSNPLLASLNIKAKDPRDYSAIASYLENKNLVEVVEKVTYNQNRLVIDRLSTIVGTAEKAGLALTIVLAVTAILVTFNTIRLAIYSNKEEIGIMRLVGASNIFINGPHIVNGIIYGVIAAFASLVIMAPIIFLADPYVSTLMPEISLTAYFTGDIIKFLGYQMLFGIVLGAISSVLAVRRYLKL
ncbi:MAG: permease-like cell division protein FtsX [bacterium]|nr:permease-like cell division protein FtsX [bacterium]